MKQNVLLKPVINSAVILILLTLLLYMTGSSPEATLWSSIGAIIITVLRTLQWIIAMVVGLLISLAVLFAIFFGAIALFDAALSRQMYEGLHHTLAAWFLPMKEQCSTLVAACQPDKSGCSAQADRDRNETLNSMNNAVRLIETQLHSTREMLGGKIEQLASRIDDLENMTAEMANRKQVDVLSDEVQGAVDSLAVIQGAVDSMRTCVEQTAGQMKEIAPDRLLGDLPERVQTLEQQQADKQVAMIDITPLENDIAGMQSELAQIREKADKALQAAADSVPESAVQERQSAPAAEEKAATSEARPERVEEEEEHRIFSYFDDPSDKKRIADTVNSTLSKDMTYKQVINLLVKELGASKGRIISSHPSLTKDYIRQCRKNS